MNCDCTDLKITKNIFGFWVCICLHFDFRGVLAQEKKSMCWISRLPSWKYTQRNIYIIDRLANCLIGVSKWSKKHTASILAILLTFISVAKTSWMITSCIIKQFECNPQRVYTCNLHKYSKTEIQTVGVASVNSTTMSMKGDQAKSNGLAFEFDLNWTHKIFIFVFCITKKFIIGWTQPVTFHICNLCL